MNKAEQFVSALKELDVENVYIYVGDAVRWDFLDKRISNRGMTIKTIAASTTSPPSFSSVVTGLQPNSHGIFTFNHKLSDKTFRIFDLANIETGFVNSIFKFAERGHEGSDPIHSVLNIKDNNTIRSLDEMSPPFIQIERGPGGHLPYGDYRSIPEYFLQDLNPKTLRNDYQRSIELDTELFLKRLESLEERRLRKDTLVIYTSDHGELLGEGGMVGHNSPMRPELVYVPCVFIHNQFPDIKIDSAIFHHTRLLPTILSILDLEQQQIRFDGESAFNGLSDSPECSVYQNEFQSELPILGTSIKGSFKYDGAWDSKGGYVFPRVGLSERLFVFGGQMFKSPKRSYIKNNLFSAARSYYKGNQHFGNPGFSKATADLVLGKTLNTKNESQEVNLSDEQKDNLKDLGYL